MMPYRIEQDSEEVRRARRAFGLAPQEANILLCLLESKIAMTEVVLEKIGGPPRDKERARKLLDLLVCRLRKKVAPIEITTVRKNGWTLRPEAKEAVTRILAETQP